MSVFHLSCEGGHDGCVDALVEHGCSVTSKTAEGKTGRELAVAGQHGAVLTVLDQAMIEAARSGETERVEHFLDTGVSIDVAHTLNGRTALMEAADGVHNATLEMLLSRGANYELLDSAGATALMLAASSGADLCISRLLEAGASVDTPQRNGMTAFMLACEGGHADAVNQLTDAGCDVTTKNVQGETGWALATKGRHTPVRTHLERLFLMAVKAGDEAKLMSYLDGGVDVDAKSADKRTALIEVASAGSEDLLMLMLRNNAGMEFKDSSGNSAFHEACAGGHAGCVEILAKRGCKTSQRNLKNKTGQQLAREAGHQPVNAVLARMKLNVTVKEDQQFSGEYTRYYVESTIDHDLVSSCTHRYSEFNELRETLMGLQKWQNEVRLFPFPKKTSVASVMSAKSAKTIQKRCQELSQFLNAVIQHGELRDADVVRNFIGAPFVANPVLAPKPAPPLQKTKSSGGGSGASGFVKPPPTKASGSDKTLTLKVEDGGAGFTADDRLTITKLNPGQASESAGVELGMRVVAFQGEMLPHGTTWSKLKAMVKTADRPWTFGFAGTIRVEAASGGAGFAATEDLVVNKVNEGSACENAGVKLGMKVVEFQDQVLRPTTTWTDLRSMVKRQPRPWTFMFKSDYTVPEDSEEDSDDDAL